MVAELRGQLRLCTGPHASCDSILTCDEKTNTKGTYLVTKSFLPTANPSHASVIALTTGTTALPVSMVPGLSPYMASKLAQTKIVEFLAAENPNLFAVTLHPGMVETEIFKKSGAKAEALPMDKGACCPCQIPISHDLGRFLSSCNSAVGRPG